MASKKDATRLNDAITARRVRLTGLPEGQGGIMSLMDAKRLASDANMDLVEVSPNADPPVCKIMDYGKFLFDQNKKMALAKKKQKQIQVKEIKFRPG
ncbi:MAG: translation initiation factor IF-3, partial [Methyloprofundus sp.]|nr:translation initiation factor IF-3 [Methyloprofundus sp.]